ncbi:hypothetical protein HDU98_005888, partial [Podochytrium sp. JEL0797]
MLQRILAHHSAETLTRVLARAEAAVDASLPAVQRSEVVVQFAMQLALDGEAADDNVVVFVDPHGGGGGVGGGGGGPAGRVEDRVGAGREAGPAPAPLGSNIKNAPIVLDDSDDDVMDAPGGLVGANHPHLKGKARALEPPAPDPPREPQLADLLAFLSDLFPDADPAWLNFKLEKQPAASDVQVLVDHIFELKGDYPKRQTGSQNKKRKFDDNHEVSEEVNEKKPAAPETPQNTRNYTLIDAAYERDLDYYRLA